VHLPGAVSDAAFKQTFQLCSAIDCIRQDVTQYRLVAIP